MVATDMGSIPIRAVSVEHLSDGVLDKLVGHGHLMRRHAKEVHKERTRIWREPWPAVARPPLALRRGRRATRRAAVLLGNLAIARLLRLSF